MLPPTVMLTIITRPGNLTKFAITRRLPRCGVAAVLVLLCLTGCGPAGPRALHRGDRLIQNGQYEDAIEPLKEAVTDLPHAPLAEARAWNLLGVAEQGLGHLDPAWRAYQQALKLDRNLAVVDYNLGCLEIQRSNYPAAITALTTYTTLRPHEADGYSRLGDAYLRLSLQLNPRDRAREFEGARAAYETAEKLSPSSDTINALGLAEIQKRPGPPGSDSVKYAVRAFQTALERSSNYPPALLNLAIVDEQYLGDSKGALDRYHQYLALDPTPANSNEVERIAKVLEIETRIQIVSRPAPRPPPVVVNPAPTNPVAVNTVKHPTPPPPSEPPSRPVANAQPPARPIVAPSDRQPPVTNPKPSNPPPAEYAAVTRPSQPTTPESVAPAVTPPPPTPTPTATAPQVEETPAPTPTPAPPPIQQAAMEPATTLDAGSAEPNAPAASRRSFFDKLNPRNWIGGKKPDTNSDATPGTRYVYPLAVTPVPGNREDATRFYQEGYKAQHDGRLDDAQGYYTKALEIDSTYFQAAVSLGLVSIDAKDYATALTSLDKALKLQSDSEKARYAFAWVLQKKKYYDDAADQLETLLSQHPDSVRAHLLVGNLYAQKLDKPHQAREHYLRVLTLDPKNSQAATITNWLKQNQ